MQPPLRGQDGILDSQTPWGVSVELKSAVSPRGQRESADEVQLPPRCWWRRGAGGGCLWQPIYHKCYQPGGQPRKGRGPRPPGDNIHAGACKLAVSEPTQANVRQAFALQKFLPKIF